MKSQDALTALNAAISDYGQAKADEGALSAQVKTGDGTIVYTEEQVAAKVAQAIADTKAADTTPYSEEQMAAVRAELKAADEKIRALSASGTVAQETITELRAQLAKIDAVLHPVAPAPVDPTPAPVEEATPAPVEAAPEAPVETAPEAPADEAPAESEEPVEGEAQA